MNQLKETQAFLNFSTAVMEVITVKWCYGCGSEKPSKVRTIPILPPRQIFSSKEKAKQGIKQLKLREFDVNKITLREVLKVII